MRIAEDSARAKGAFIRFNSFFRSALDNRDVLSQTLAQIRRVHQTSRTS
jgi:hypothetical protein